MAHVQNLTFDRLQDLYSHSNASSTKDNQHKLNKNSNASKMADELFAMTSTNGTPGPDLISDDEKIQSNADISTVRTMQTPSDNGSTFEE